MAYATSFADLVTSTLNDLGPYNVYEQVAQTRQKFEVLSHWLKEDKVNVGSGVAIQRQLMVGDGSTGPARHASPMTADNVNLADILKKIQVEWVHADTSWMVVRQHMLMNRQPSAILSYIESQRNWAWLSMFEEMETKAWGTAPTSSNTDDPWGVKYWVVTNSSTGFNGAGPGGATSIAGLTFTNLPGDQKQFNNYTTTYTLAAGITAQDAMPKLRTAYRKIGFESPLTMKDYQTGAGDNYRLYTNETGIGGFEEICMANADLSLRDVASVDGLNLSFKKNPIIWISALDSDTTNPVYMINHSVFAPHVLEGDYLTESDVSAPRQHNIREYFVDLTYNFVCVDRRRCAVIYGV